MIGFVIWALLALLIAALLAAANLYRKLVVSENAAGYWQRTAQRRLQDRDEWITAYTRMDRRSSIAENALKAIIDQRTAKMANIGYRMIGVAKAALVRIENERA